MARTAERGSIISFIVVGVGLTALVVGGIYTAKHLASQRQSSTVAVVDEPEAPAEVRDEQKDAATQEAEKKAAAEKAAEAEKKAQAEREAQAAKEREAKAEAEAAEKAAETEGEGDSETATGVAALPQTGPVELAGTGMVLAIITGSVLVYRRSSRVL